MMRAHYGGAAGLVYAGKDVRYMPGFPAVSE